MPVFELLNKLVKESGVTYSHISKKTGISIDAISKSLRGERALKADEFILICCALNIDMERFRKSA